MKYARIDLHKVTYRQLDCKWVAIYNPDIPFLNNIYHEYCRYKKFNSVMPIFDSEYTDTKNDIIGYYDNDKIVAFSIIRKYDRTNVEAVQFAWNYNNPKLNLGIVSLKHECALYRDKGYKYLYLGGADEYKSKFEGFEILGPV